MKGKKDLVILIDKKTREKVFTSFYEEDIFTFYSDDYFYVTFKESKVRHLFNYSLTFDTKSKILKKPSNEIKVFEFKIKEFSKLFPQYELIYSLNFYEGIFIISYYKCNGFMILNIINKGNLTKEKLIKRLKKIDDLFIGYFLYDDDFNLLDYMYNYKIMNEVILDARDKYFYIDFLDIKINKCNRMLKKDRHIIRD